MIGKTNTGTYCNAIEIKNLVYKNSLKTLQIFTVKVKEKNYQEVLLLRYVKADSLRMQMFSRCSSIDLNFYIDSTLFGKLSKFAHSPQVQLICNSCMQFHRKFSFSCEMGKFIAWILPQQSCKALGKGTMLEIGGMTEYLQWQQLEY